QNLTTPIQGGRAKRGIAESYLAQVKLVLDGSMRFASKYDLAMHRAVGNLQDAQQEMKAAIVPHTPPAKGSLQAWDPDELTPVNKRPVVVDTQERDEWADNLMAELAAVE